MEPKEVSHTEVNKDILLEYDSQLRYLETSVNMLKKNLEKDREIHKQDNIRIMKNNVKLIRDINKLRRVLKNIKGSGKSETLLQRKRNKLELLKKQGQRLKGNVGSSGDIGKLFFFLAYGFLGSMDQEDMEPDMGEKTNSVSQPDSERGSEAL